MADGPSPTPAPQEITKSTLAEAATKNDAAVKEFLTGTETERTAQVERVRLALDLLKGGMPDTNDVDRARVARVSRELLESQLDAVRKELDTSTDENLKKLEGKISAIRDVASQNERAATPIVSVESIKLETNEIARELKDGDWMTWAKYAGIAVAAGIATKWIWDHTIGWLWKKAAGDEKKPGIFRRAAGWAVGLGGAALGVVGLSRFSASFPNFLPEALRVAQKAAEKTAEGAKEGFESVPGVTVRNILDLAGENGRTAEVERKHERGEYASDTDYQNARVKALALDGVQMVWEGTGAHLIRAGKHLVVKEMEFVGAIFNFARSGGDAEAGWEVYEVWVNGTVVYASSFGALSAAITLARTGSPSRALVTLATESAVWPVTVGKKLNEARVLLFTRNGNVTLREIAGSPGFHWNRMMGSQYNPVNLLRSQTTGRMDALVKEWQGWKELERSVRGGGDRELIKSLQEKCEAIEQEILRSADALRKQRAGGAALDLTADLKHILDKGTNLDTVAHALNELAEPSGARLASLMDDWVRLQGNMRQAGSNALLKSQFQQGLDDTLKEIERTTTALRAQLKAGKTVEGLTPALKTIVEDGTDTIKLSRLLDTGTAAEAAPTAPKVVTEAAETGDEWARAATAARKALLAPDATPEATSAIDDAIAKCKALGMKSADALDAVQDANVLLTLTKTPANQMTKLAVVVENTNDVSMSMRRVCTFLAGFADNLDDAALATKLLDQKLLRTLAASDVQPDELFTLVKTPALRKALTETDDLSTAVTRFVRWNRVRSLNGIVNIGGAALSAVMLGVDVYTLLEMQARHAKVIADLDNTLRKAGFEKTGGGYVHPRTKTKVNLASIQENIENLSNPQKLRTATSAVGTGVAAYSAATAIFAPSLALGPAGLVVVAVELTVIAGTTVLEDNASRQFLLDTPTSVLAMMNLGETVGKSEKDVLDESSSWLWSDAMHWEETNEKDKASLRKKAVAMMFFRELGTLAQESPDVTQRILAARGLSDTQDTQQMDAGSFLDEENGAFWTKDYEAIVKPYLAARLFQLSKDDTVKWSQFRDLKIDEGVFDFENIAPADMRLALREAAHVYAQHLKERDFQSEKKKYGELAARQQQEKITTVQSIEVRAQQEVQLALAKHTTAHLGDASAFGTKISELDDGSGKTSIERYLTDLMKKLDDRAAVTGAKAKEVREAMGEGSVAAEIARWIPGLNLAPLPHDLAPRGDERAIIGSKPFAGVSPADGTEVRLEDLAGVSQAEKERPLAVADVQSLIEKGRSLHEELKGVGTAMRENSVWYAQPSHFQKLKEYSYVLQRQPAIANEKAVQGFLGKVKTLSEGFSWEDGQFGSDFLAKRNDAFRSALDALAAMNRSLDARTYHLAPVERAAIEPELVCVPGRERLLYRDSHWMRGNPSVLYVEHDGKTVEHRPVPGSEYRHVVPGGMLLCRMTGRMEKGKQTYDYAWSFERGVDAAPGTELYVYMKSDGAEQPGKRLVLPDVKTVTKAITIDRTLITESIDSINGTALITLSYTDADGSPKTIAGTLHQILQSKIVGWKKLRNTDPKTQEKTEWTEFVPKDGITLVNCRIDHFDTPRSTQYLWKKKVNRAA